VFGAKTMTANGAFFQTRWQLSIAFWAVFDHNLTQQSDGSLAYYIPTDIIINQYERMSGEMIKVDAFYGCVPI
jgi:hypothetical protein